MDIVDGLAIKEGMKGLFLLLLLLLIGAWFFVFNKERKLQSAAKERGAATADKIEEMKAMAQGMPVPTEGELEAAPRALPPSATPPQLSEEQLQRLEDFRNNPKTKAALQSPPDFIPPPPPSDLSIPPPPQ